MKPTVTLQFRKLGSTQDWIDLGPDGYAVFEHERHLAEERVKEINATEKAKAAKDSRNLFFEYRVKP